MIFLLKKQIQNTQTILWNVGIFLSAMPQRHVTDSHSRQTVSQRKL